MGKPAETEADDSSSASTVATRARPRPGGLQGLAIVLAQVVRTEGATGLYKGIGPQLAKAVLAAALLLMTRDILHARLNRPSK
eukprot:NODE_3408_length_672_cov_121.455859_g2427_i0.p4 GENE.NODE_3408_length_672_cov_121.455859_g2427_i0~~NODE_3408_length_672_cov_121.455859_g2427_i0.p4  ORF type:complete len:92 (-),score=41.22 NODE_3408_length_672_cov_121.455859_g2427_i0:396-644(-)